MAAKERMGASLERDALLRRFIHTEAFCLTVSALMHFIQGGNEYEYHLLYSVLIGTATWIIIDLSRVFLPLDPDTGWPRGLVGIAIAPTGILGGFLIGTGLADAISGKSTWDMPSADLRMALLATILGGTAAVLFLYFTGRTARQQAKIESVQRTAAEAQLRLLETQLEPHMLFNTLANLRVLIQLDPKRAQLMLDRLIAYLRATLGGSRAMAHPLSAEFDRLDDYLQLMVIRMGERLQYTLDLPPLLRTVPVPPLLLQPLVENAIKHGLEPCEECGGLSVRASLQGDWIRIEVADTGVGMSEDATRRVSGGGGFGLVHVRERLAKTYGGRARVAVGANEPHGTRITLDIPLDEMPDPEWAGTFDAATAPAAPASRSPEPVAS